MFRSSRLLGRIARVSALGLFGLSMLPAGGVAAAPSDPPLDVAAALLMPADVEQFGFENYGVDSGRFYSLGELGIFTPEMIEEEGLTNLDEGGMHILWLHPVGGMDANDGPDVAVMSVIVEYPDEKSAELGFAAWEDESAFPNMVDLENPPALGDESEVTDIREEPSAANDYVPTHRIDVSFRVGNLHAVVNLSGFDVDVDREQVEEMAAFLEERVYELVDTGEVDGVATPGLSLYAPRYVGDMITPSRSQYCTIDSTPVTSAYGQPYEEVKKIVDDYGVAANYCSMTKLLMNDEDDGIYLAFATMTFDRASGAAAYVDDTLEEFQQPDSNATAVEELPIDDLTIDGDTVFAMTYESERDGQMFVFTDLMVQVDNLVIDLRVQGVEAPDLAFVESLMKDALACAEDGGCTATIDAPAELVDFQAEQTALFEQL